MSRAEQQEVYISYSRHEEDRNSTILLIHREITDVKFKVDTKEIQYRDDFLDFIDEIGKADRVIVLFSEAYMKSYYCMSELTKIVQHGGDLDKRVFLVRDPDYPLNENEKRIRQYWEEVLSFGDKPRSKEYTQVGKLSEIQEIYDFIDNIFTKFKTISSPTARELLISNYVPVLNWLCEDSSDFDVDERYIQSDEEYLQEARLKIREYLDNTVLKNTLQKHLNCQNQEDTVLLNALCTCDSKQLVKLLDGALTKTLKTLKNELNYESELRNLLHKLASTLSIFVIDDAWVKQVDLSRGTVIKIPAKSEFSGAAASARAYQTYPLYHAEQQSVDIMCMGKVPLLGRQASWSNKNNKIVKSLIAHIWNHVFPNSPLQAKDVDAGKTGFTEIDDEHIEEFNHYLLKTKRHFYLQIPMSSEYEYLQDASLMHELSSTFPALMTFKLITGKNAQLVISNDLGLRMAYQQFLIAL